MSTPLSDQALELIGRRFAVLSAPMRLRLLQLLFEGEQSVNALVALTGGCQPNISRHLKALLHARLVKRHKQGLQVFYGVADLSTFAVCQLIHTSLKEEALLQERCLKS